MHGAGGPPGVALIAPGGRQITPNGKVRAAGRAAALPDPTAKATYVGIQHPRPGRWTVLSDPKRIGRVLAQLTELGIGISLDDFGTGYSSLTHLKSLPVCELKLDRRLRRMHRVGASRRVTETVDGGQRLVEGGVGEHRDELISAETCHEVLPSDGRAQAFGGRNQDAVAGIVSVQRSAFRRGSGSWRMLRQDIGSMRQRGQGGHCDQKARAGRAGERCQEGHVRDRRLTQTGGGGP